MYSLIVARHRKVLFFVDIKYADLPFQPDEYFPQTEQGKSRAHVHEALILS